MRILYTSDLHGRRAFWARLLDLAREERPDAVVLGGDLFGAHLAFGDTVSSQRSFVREFFREWLLALRSGVPGVRPFFIPGNDDWAAATAEAEALERDGLVTALHGRAVPLGEGLSIAGLGLVPLTPFRRKDWDRFDTPDQPPPAVLGTAYASGPGGRRPIGLEEIRSRGTLEEELDRLGRCSDPARTIYAIHTPPYGTALDHLWSGRHVGSRAVQAFIERSAPPLTLHGHIHESPRMSGRAEERLGKSLMVNLGQGLRRLHAGLLEADRSGATLRLLR